MEIRHLLRLLILVTDRISQRAMAGTDWLSEIPFLKIFSMHGVLAAWEYV